MGMHPQLGELTTSLKEVVRVMRKIPTIILIGIRFWRQYELTMDLERNVGSIWNGQKRYCGKLVKQESTREEEDLWKITENSEVGTYLKTE